VLFSILYLSLLFDHTRPPLTIGGEVRAAGISGNKVSVLVVVMLVVRAVAMVEV
jgi:hypothetical protein